MSHKKVPFPSAPERSHDGVAVKLITIKFVGATVLLVALGGIAATLLYPANAERIWLTIGPLISTAIASMLFGVTRNPK